jgi:hypothetical protein
VVAGVLVAELLATAGRRWPARSVTLALAVLLALVVGPPARAVWRGYATAGAAAHRAATRAGGDQARGARVRLLDRPLPGTLAGLLLLPSELGRAAPARAAAARGLADGEPSGRRP